MNWTAVVPVKQGADRKSRLAAHLSREERSRLSDWMVVHVLRSLRTAPSIERIVILSTAPHGDSAEWCPDLGRGMNAELAAMPRTSPMLVVHGDLPLVTAGDIEALIEAAGQGIAIAPDRHGSGTNALAITDDGPFAFAFGADSCRLHLEAAGDRAVIVNRPGLSIDIDTPDDLAFARAAGFAWPL
jgi:2-phospho-L-lactate guanylyltransferase